MRDLIVTGIPRGGTTLLAALIDSAQDAICLSEPEAFTPCVADAESAADAALRIERKFADIRAAITRGDPVEDLRGADGAAVTNYLSDTDGGAARRSIAAPRAIVRQMPGDQFVLAIKHNALFAGVLPEIAARGAFELVGLMRAPRDVFQSWLSVPFPVASARLPAGEKFWPDLAAIGQSEEPLPVRMARLYALLADRLARTPALRLLRYETITADPVAFFDVLGLSRGGTSLVSSPTEKPITPAVADALNALRTLGGAANEMYPS